jgi:hypothetical protein
MFSGSRRVANEAEQGEVNDRVNEVNESYHYEQDI